MADGHTNSGSVSITNSDCKSDKIENKIAKSAFLFNNEGNFAWKGDLATLKVFVDSIIKSHKCKDGKWSSPREEEKQFKTAEFTLKWFGQKKEKLVIMKDNKEKILHSALEACAQPNGVENQHENSETTTHVVDAIEPQQQQQDSQQSDANLPVSAVCKNCEDYKRQITDILTSLNELKTKQQEESQQNTSRSTTFENTMITLSEQNIKMAAEIDSLKSTVTELSCENMSIKCVLDMKQSEWTEVKEKKSKKETKSTKTSSTSTDTRTFNNPFEMLDVEKVPDVEEVPDLEEVSPSNNNNNLNRRENYSKVVHRKNGQTNDLPVIYDSSERTRSTKNTSDSVTKKPTKKPNKPNHEKTVLVIGDSMVKHIDANKIGRAARNKAISHSYNGATVNQLTKKFEEHLSEEKEFSTIILHVGTNDLVRDDPKKVAANMENLINRVKVHTEKIAVSGATKRYDGKVNNKKTEQYNDLVHSLCSKHKITYIDNSCIGKSLLNGSNLHLNHEGDKTLGSGFCTYLKSDRIRNTNMASNCKDNQFFRQTHGRQKDWTMYLAHVKQMMKQKAD